MIFSLTNSENNIQLPKLKGVDVFCFFTVKNGISCDESLWWSAITASLRMKHEVLILETEIQGFPSWDPSKRWQVGENWSWLSPRSLTVISDTCSPNHLDYQAFKKFLKNSK